jgi:putative FmdB family regulatory protein
MPLYEYRCPNCGRRFEKLQRRQDAEDRTCPHCGAQDAEKQASSFASTSGAAGRSSGCGGSRGFT